MNTVLRNEFRRNTNKVTITILALFVLFGIMIHQVGIKRYKSAVAQQSYFLEIEKIRFNQYRNYYEYGRMGFRILSEPGKLYSLFINSATFGDLIGYITNSDKLDLTKPQIGNNSFDKPLGGVLDFSWYILLIGCVICLFYGLDTYRNEDYLRFLLTFAKPATVYFSISIGRILLLIGSLSFIILVAFFQFLFNGLLSVQVIKGLLAFLFNSSLFIVPLFIFSSVMGNIRDRLLSVSLTLFILFGLLFIWPEILSSFISQNAIKNVKPFYQHEIMKKNVFINYEKKFIEQMRKATPEERLKIEKNVVNDFFDKDFKKIEKLEFEMIDKTENLAKRFHFWSIFNPATFYKSVNNEISSRGYMAYLAFYRDLHQKQKQFLRFYFDKRFNENNPKVEPFLKDEGLIYKLKPNLPHYFLLGVIVQLFYITLLFIIGYFAFKKAMFPREKKAVFSNFNLKFETGKHYVYSYEEKDHDIPEQVFNILMGKPGDFTGKISIDGESIVTSKKKNYVYLPCPDVLPQKLKVRSIIDLFSGLYEIPKTEKEKIKKEFEAVLKERFANIKSTEKLNLMIKTAEYKNADIYFLNNFLINISSGKLPPIVDQIKKKKVLIIQLDSIHVPYVDMDYFALIMPDIKSQKYEEFPTEWKIKPAPRL